MLTIPLPCFDRRALHLLLFDFILIEQLGGGIVGVVLNFIFKVIFSI
jgi:hypothetical protein